MIPTVYYVVCNLENSQIEETTKDIQFTRNEYTNKNKPKQTNKQTKIK
jgi:hypothetical protein